MNRDKVSTPLSPCLYNTLNRFQSSIIHRLDLKVISGKLRGSDVHVGHQHDEKFVTDRGPLKRRTEDQES